jgi:hypothetical protein
MPPCCNGPTSSSAWRGATWRRCAGRSFLLKAYAGVTDRDLDVFDPVGLPLETYRTSCREIAGLLRQALPKIRALGD